MTEQLGSTPAYSRDDKGLLDGINYTYRQDGSIDWRAMVDSNYLVPNKENFPEGTDTTTLNISELDDSHLLLVLPGIKEIAGIRGFTKVDYEVLESGSEYVSVKCTIDWIPNFETGMQPVQYSALADAHESNTSGFARKFLMAIAENRSFSRTVRNFLRINVIGQDELDPKEQEELFDII